MFKFVNQRSISRACCRSRHLATLANADGAFEIPVIDFNEYRKASRPSEKRKTADAIINAFKQVGFVYLSGHGIPESKIQRAFAKSADFFRLPAHTKASLAWEDPRANRGFVQMGRERTTQSEDPTEIATLKLAKPDYKETMEIGRDWESVWKNRWPAETDVPGFKSTMLDFYQTCHELHVLIMQSIALGLNLNENFFDNLINEQSHNLRLLSYPPVKASLLREDGSSRTGAHSDYGSLTLLFQDMVGGLEVQNLHTGNFNPAKPIPGTIVINVGDLMQRWSNDLLRSTVHRVVSPPTQHLSNNESITEARQSIAFFCNPNFSAEITCLPNCHDQSNKPKYPPIGTEAYIVGRLASTIGAY